MRYLEENRMSKEELILKIDAVLLMVLILCITVVIGTLNGQMLNPGIHNQDFWTATNATIGGK
jgi:hypothetical protein